MAHPERQEIHQCLRTTDSIKNLEISLRTQTLMFKMYAYFKMVQKINLKLKGTNHILEESAYGDVFKQETMVVGIDVTHPPPGAEGAPSVAAVVASCDKYLSQWPADLRINNIRQEMVKLLRQMLTTRLEHYKKTNQGSLPENILIYRDGVGEGQYKIVLEEELPRLRDACQGVYGKDYVEGVYPRISLIVVGKRHHTRFYKTAQGALIPGKPGNPQAGTVVTLHIRRICITADYPKDRRQHHHPRLQLGLFPSIAYRDHRHSTPSPLLCPSRRNLPSEVHRPRTSARAPDKQHVPPVRQGHRQR